MSDEFKAQKKLYILLLQFAIFFFVFCYSAPYDNMHSASYTLQFCSIVYTFICCVTYWFVDFKKLNKKEYMLAIFLGLLAVGNIVPLHLTGIINGLCTMITFLASLSLFQSYHNGVEIKLIKSKKIGYIVQSIMIAFVIALVYLLIRWWGRGINFSFDVADVFRSIGAAVSEEIILTMFLYAILVRLCNGKRPTWFITFVIISGSRSLPHVIDLIIMNGFLNNITLMLGYIVMSVPCMILIFKRDLLNAIICHFMLDIIIMTFFNL